MEKIIRPLSENLKPATLYLDDIENIIDTLRTVSSEVIISTREYLLKDLQELRELKKEQLTHLEIEIHEPYVSISFEPHRIWLYIAKDEPISRGLFEKVKEIVSRRERKIARITHSSWLSGILIGTFFPLLSLGIDKASYWIIFTSIVLFIIAILISWYGFQDRFNKYSVIVLKNKNELPSFWKRNSDKIVLMILSAIIGSFITQAFSKIFGN